jgi:hypothetical protein
MRLNGKTVAIDCDCASWCVSNTHLRRMIGAAAEVR